MNFDLFKLHNWIDKDTIHWHGLSENPNATQLLEQNFDKINWFLLSFNPNARIRPR